MLEKLKYKFEDPDLLTAALTHRSAHHQSGHIGLEIDNQRLEFLGDAVLDLVISDHLYHHEPHLSEGEMSRIRAGLVCEARLAEVAERLNLGEAIILGAGESAAGGRKKASVLADAMEALLGAIYLDGGYEAVRQETHRLWKPWLCQPEKWPIVLADFKTRLQEETQARALGVPHYALIDSEGPAHARRFTMSVSLGEQLLAHGEAGTKKEAEQHAAQTALALLQAQWASQQGDA